MSEDQRFVVLRCISHFHSFQRGH